MIKVAGRRGEEKSGRKQKGERKTLRHGVAVSPLLTLFMIIFSPLGQGEFLSAHWF